jgi:hypothetical protein
MLTVVITCCSFDQLSLSNIGIKMPNFVVITMVCKKWLCRNQTKPNNHCCWENWPISCSCQRSKYLATLNAGKHMHCCMTYLVFLTDKSLSRDGVIIYILQRLGGIICRSLNIFEYAYRQYDCEWNAPQAYN